MKRLKDLLDAIHEDIETSSDAEIKEACRLILDAESMSAGERDTLRACYQRGPVKDGDVPSKMGRNSLLNRGYLEKVICKGEDGYQACTYKGALVYRLLAASNG